MNRQNLTGACILALALIASSGAAFAYRSLSGPGGKPGATTFPSLDLKNPCGPLSATLASHLLNRPVRLEEAGKVIPTDPLGRTSMDELIKGLEKMGLGAVGVRLTPSALGRLRVPAILFVDGIHFVAVRPATPRSVVVLDVPLAPRTVPVTDLGYEWGGEAIVVAERPEDIPAELALAGIEPAP